MRTFALTAFALAASANAAVIFTGAQYSENFDGLPMTSVSPSPFSNVVGQQFPLDPYGVNGWSVAKADGTGTGAMPFVADFGNSNSGGIHSYGLSDTDSERALGTLASGSNTPAFGIEIMNSAAFTITDVALTFDREVWRSSTSTAGVPNTALFAYGTTGDGVLASTYLTDPAMTLNPAGDLVGLAPVATNGPLNGNDPANSDLVVVNISGLFIAPGDSLFLRWSDFNDQGNDAGLAVDNFTFNAIPTPGAFALLGLGGLLIARRRR